MLFLDFLKYKSSGRNILLKFSKYIKSPLSGAGVLVLRNVTLTYLNVINQQHNILGQVKVT